MRNTINIAIIGAVSAGKSTLLNTIFVNQYSDMKIKRTTMIPQKYHEVANREDIDANTIKELNREINENIIKKMESNSKIEYGDIKEIDYYVPKTHKFINLEDDVFLTIYDIPGLNDSRTKDLYYQYIEENFVNFDLIIFVIDINSGLNTSDELDILNLIIKNCKTNFDKYGIVNRVIFLANKCDELYLRNGKLVLEDEYEEMYEQIKKTVKNEVDKLYPNLGYMIIPISSETAYIYRMYERNPDVELDMKHLNKFGYNEFGKANWNKFSEEQKIKKVKEIIYTKDKVENAMLLSGFKDFSIIMNDFLDKNNQYIYLINHIRFDIRMINDFNKINIKNEVKSLHNIFLDIWKLNKKFEQNEKNNLKLLLNHLSYYIERYDDNIIDILICNIKNDVQSVELAKEVSGELLNLFDIKPFRKLNEKIINSLNCFYVDEIKSKNIELSKGYEYMKKLKNNNYEIPILLVNNLFNNNKIMENSFETIIKYIENLYNDNIILQSDKIDILIEYLKNVYNDIFLDKFKSKDINLNMYILTLENYWANIENIIDRKIENLDINIKNKKKVLSNIFSKYRNRFFEYKFLSKKILFTIFDINCNFFPINKIIIEEYIIENIIESEIIKISLQN